MTSVDGISAVNICTDEISFARVCLEDVGLVGASVRSQDGVLIDIVGVRLAPPGMIRWKAERIEVLICGDYRKEGVMVFVGWRRKFGFDDGSGYGNGVIFLGM